MTTAQEELTPEAHAFVQRRGLIDALEHTLSLVRKHFPDAQRVTGEVIQDPDACDEWLAINVDIPAEARDLLLRDDAFMAEWVRATGWQAANGLTVMVFGVDGPS